VLSRRSALLRPAPTASRPPDAFPGITGYRQASLPAARSGGAEEALPSSQDDRPYVQRPIRRRVLQRPLPDPRRLPWPSPSRDRLGTLLAHPKAGPLDDACSGFTHVADRTVASAPLRTRPLDHARGHHYQGPRHLPGPDSHRQAALNLSLGLRHDDLLLFMAPEQSGRTTRKRQSPTAKLSRLV
jgi:hypothetical protein